MLLQAPDSMPKQSLQEQMYGFRGPSTAQRITLAILVGGTVVLAWWMLFFGGIGIAGAWIGKLWLPGGWLRRAAIASALTIYFLRILATEFVFLKRGISWNEVFTIAPWVLFNYMLFCIAGGTNRVPLGAPEAGGAFLFVFGSWMNSWSEYQRHVWKQRPENHGRLYTLGLFRYSRHPNYFGDLLSFSGICLLCGRWVTAVVPLLMLMGFVFVNVPVLDVHLRQHYGTEFDEYARKTHRLIPFLY